MSDVNIRMTVEDAEAAAAWARFNRDQRMAEEKFNAIQKAGQQAGQKTAQGFDTAKISMAGLNAAVIQVGQSIATLAGVGSPMAAFHTLTRLIRAEWDLILDRQKTAADKQMDVSAAWRNASAQLIGRQTSITPDSLLGTVVSDPRRRGVDPKDLLNTFREVAGSAGNVPLEDVLGATMESSKLFPQWTLEERSAVVRGSVLMKKVFGQPTEQTFAGVAQGMAIDPTMTAAQYGQFVLPTISSLSALGGNKDSFEDLLALTSAFGQRSGDVTGRSAGTNLLNVVRQVQRDAAGAGLIKPDASVMETIKAAATSPVLQEKLLGVFAQTELGTSAHVLVKSMEEDLKNRRELSVEARKFVAARELLQFDRPGNMLRQEFDAGRASILGLTPAAVAQTVAADSLITGSKFSSAAETTRESRQSEDIFNILQTHLGTRGASRAALVSSLGRMGFGFTGQTVIATQFDIQDRLTSRTEEDTKKLRRQYERTYAERVIAGEQFASDKSGIAAAREILSREQGDKIISLLEQANAQRGNNVTAEKAAMLNLVPQRPPVNNMNDPGRLRLPGNMR